MITLVSIIAAATTSLFVYSLPQTDLVVEVTARKEVFHSGPYAKYAQKYLGVKAQVTDKVTFSLVDAKLTARVEADFSRRFSVEMTESEASRFFTLTSQGLIFGFDSSSSTSGRWSFPLSEDFCFEKKGIPANLTVESSTLYKKGKGSVQQTAVVEKSSEKKAKEVADMIFKIRDNRYKILVGDTDATYSGDALRAAIEELNRLENDYLTLFLGYSEFQIQSATFDVVPSPSAPKQFYVAFRLSENEGLVGPDNISGRPFCLELTPEEISETAATETKSSKKKPSGILYRIPAICKVRLTDGVTTYFQYRQPIYQLGKEVYYPVNNN